RGFVSAPMHRVRRLQVIRSKAISLPARTPQEAATTHLISLASVRRFAAIAAAAGATIIMGNQSQFDNTRVQDKLKRKLQSDVQQAFEGFWWRLKPGSSPRLS